MTAERFKQQINATEFKLLKSFETFLNEQVRFPLD